jgi:hypothetical protein
LSNRKGVGALRNSDNDVVIDDGQRANLLNSYFSSVCTIDDGNMPPVSRVVQESVSLDTVDFSPAKVLAAIKKLKPNKSGGPDGFPPLLFKQLAPALATPLSLIFESLMSVGCIPSEWAHAFVTPIYKGGNASDISNYRPVSLTCIACKLMERIISNDMLAYLRQHNAITAQQHGFLSGRSTTTNLLESINDWTIAIKNKQSVIVAYIDYSKAFDTVSHTKLLSKLTAYGISGRLLSWIAGFLSNRTQQTRVGSTLSNVARLVSGVVQGSVIGPLLFLLFINDVVDLFTDNRCACKLYADDLKIYTNIELSDGVSVLQSKLDELNKWSEQWQLSISHKKTNIMLISLHNTTSNNMQFYIGDNAVHMVGEVKDLGVALDNRLRFATHINQIVARAFVRTNLLFKCFTSRDTATLVRAFIAYVRPLLEYASCVWSPYHIVTIKQIESVQRKFTKKLPGLKDLSYSDRLVRSGIERLELRRIKQDLILTYKIYFGLMNTTATDLFTPANTDHDTRGHKYKLMQSHCRVDVRKHFFAERIVKLWNNLSAQERDFSNLGNFKSFLNKTDLSMYLLG